MWAGSSVFHAHCRISRLVTDDHRSLGCRLVCLGLETGAIPEVEQFPEGFTRFGPDLTSIDMLDGDITDNPKVGARRAEVEHERVTTMVERHPECRVRLVHLVLESLRDRDAGFGVVDDAGTGEGDSLRTDRRSD